tara:strand:- start:26609 stop:26827 length:219 start_codon:yes stop_codon:yes gene_type:complete
VLDTVPTARQTLNSYTERLAHWLTNMAIVGQQMDTSLNYTEYLNPKRLADGLHNLKKPDTLALNTSETHNPK